MIGRSLGERFGASSGLLTSEEAVAAVREALSTQGENLVRVRKQDAGMIACVVLHADDTAVAFCRSIGLEMKPGGAAVFGLMGTDAAEALVRVTEHQRTWLSTPSGPRETKIAIFAKGFALCSVVTENGQVTINPIPAILN